MLRFEKSSPHPIPPADLQPRDRGRTEGAAGTAAPVFIVGLGLLLAGCSADFLRFDAPAFNLNGDTAVAERDTETAVAPTGSALYTQRTSYAGDRFADDTAVARVDRGGPDDDRIDQARSTVALAPQRSKPDDTTNFATTKRVASAAPITDTPKTSYHTKAYAPVTTGALRSGSNEIVVRAGDTLYQLSRRHGVSVAALREANGMTGNVIRPGQTLRMPGGNLAGNQAPQLGSRQRDDRTAAAPRYRPAPYRAPTEQSAPRQALTGGSVYTVRPGDSLYAISRRTGVSVADLKQRNNIRDVRAIQPGTRLALTGSGNAPATRRPAYRSPRGADAQVASRTNYGQSSQIKAKPIRTMPIVRTNADPTSGTSSVRQPRILNQRQSAPIATKPAEKVAMVPPAAPPQSQFRWPARGRIIAPFNHSGQGVKNDGINISLPEGTNVGAAEEGVVAYAGSELKGYGNLVLLRHDNGWVSAYAHASELLVKRGDRVKRGQTIAKAGRSGDVTQPQLHFELRKGAKPVDPMPHMDKL